MKKLMILALVLVSSFAQASYFNDDVTAAEAVQALANCPGPVSSLARYEGQYVDSVTGKHTQIKVGLDQKKYTIISKVGGTFGGAPAETIATLTLVATIQQSAHAAPASVSWKCRLD